MSTEHSKACCERPVPKPLSYTAKGQWIELDGMDTYITGDTKAQRAVLWVYDIFGFSSQILRGADILAHSSKEPILVLIPDWFRGSTAELSWVPPITEEQQQKLGTFIQTKASAAIVVPHVRTLAKCVKAVYQRIQRLGVFGFCWGGKLVSLACQGEALFDVAAQTSPARVDPEEAKQVTVPMALLVSGDEDAGLVARYAENIRAEKHVEMFPSQIHGWMSARGDLNCLAVWNEYQRGYRVIVQFLDKYL